MSDKLEKAYQSSKHFYDDLLTQKSLIGKIYMHVFWGGTDDNVISEKMLSYIPDDFKGRILDVPVGTAIFTHKKWARVSNADIQCLDYSEDMLNQASKRLTSYKHITCLQGDVADLPYDDESCDCVISMNGFHVFPNKEMAYQEIYRVLKPKGTFICSFYIKGQNKLTDWLVHTILAKKGWFTPPFQTYSEVKSLLQTMYNDIDIDHDGSIVYFKCVSLTSDLAKRNVVYII